MKALSLTQPWATLVAIGAKRIETRSWSTSYRGEIAIHAAKGFPRWAKDTMDEEPFRSVLSGYDITSGNETQGNLPRGAIVAVADILSVLATDDPALKLTPKESAFGDYTPGRFAWLLVYIRQLDEPIPCRGALGLWTVPEDVAERVRAGTTASRANRAIGSVAMRRLVGPA